MAHQPCGRRRRPDRGLRVAGRCRGCQAVLHVLAQPLVRHELGRLRTGRTAIPMPLRDRSQGGVGWRIAGDLLRSPAPPPWAAGRVRIGRVDDPLTVAQPAAAVQPDTAELWTARVPVDNGPGGHRPCGPGCTVRRSSDGNGPAGGGRAGTEGWWDASVAVYVVRRSGGPRVGGRSG